MTRFDENLDGSDDKYDDFNDNDLKMMISMTEFDEILYDFDDGI